MGMNEEDKKSPKLALMEIGDRRVTK